MPYRDEYNEEDWPQLDEVKEIAEMSLGDDFQGYRDEGLLESAIGATQGQHYYGGENNPFRLAAHLTNNIQRQQSLVEGNKRTGSNTGAAFLSGLMPAGRGDSVYDHIEANSDEFADGVVSMAEGGKSAEEFGDWWEESYNKHHGIDKESAQDSGEYAEDEFKGLHDYVSDQRWEGGPSDPRPRSTAPAPELGSRVRTSGGVEGYVFDAKDQNTPAGSAAVRWDMDDVHHSVMTPFSFVAHHDLEVLEGPGVELTEAGRPKKTAGAHTSGDLMVESAKESAQTDDHEYMQAEFGEDYWRTPSAREDDLEKHRRKAVPRGRDLDIHDDLLMRRLDDYNEHTQWANSGERDQQHFEAYRDEALRRGLVDPVPTGVDPSDHWSDMTEQWWESKEAAQTDDEGYLEAEFGKDYWRLQIDPERGEDGLEQYRRKVDGVGRDIDVHDDLIMRRLSDYNEAAWWSQREEDDVRHFEEYKNEALRRGLVSDKENSDWMHWNDEVENYFKKKEAAQTDDYNYMVDEFGYNPKGFGNSPANSLGQHATELDMTDFELRGYELNLREGYADEKHEGQHDEVIAELERRGLDKMSAQTDDPDYLAAEFPKGKYLEPAAGDIYRSNAGNELELLGEHDDNYFTAHVRAVNMPQPEDDLVHFVDKGASVFKDVESPEYMGEKWRLHKRANVLDPIQAGLDEHVFENAQSELPDMKSGIVEWAIENLRYALEMDGGWPELSDEWLELYMTGSLTTYQWSEDSDLDMSVFVDWEYVPEKERKNLVSLLTAVVDGMTIPGTDHPVQYFVQPEGILPEHIFRPGLRSAYDMINGFWLVPPEKDRVKDVQAQSPEHIEYAKAIEDKFRNLLAAGDTTGVRWLWDKVHGKRRRHQGYGHGDYVRSNVVYKWIANAGLLPEIGEQLGIRIQTSRKTALNHDFEAGDRVIVSDKGNAPWAGRGDGTKFHGTLTVMGPKHNDLSMVETENADGDVYPIHHTYLERVKFRGQGEHDLESDYSGLEGDPERKYKWSKKAKLEEGQRIVNLNHDKSRDMTWGEYHKPHVLKEKGLKADDPLAGTIVGVDNDVYDVWFDDDTPGAIEAEYARPAFTGQGDGEMSPAEYEAVEGQPVDFDAVGDEPVIPKYKWSKRNG